MLPLNLQLENFYCHFKSEIDFTQFSLAVIIGVINNNEKKSNGAGKSTIFSAIKYVLFNEVDTSSLDKVIKHDANYCKVSFEFQSSLNNQIYKIVRYRGKKPGTDVRLYHKIGDEWEDLTQRKTSDTEKEIQKLIKINYRTFSNSVLFAQGDLSGIANMTPRERKTALREALQLGVYSKYEQTAKKKVSDLTKEVEKHQILITALGDPEQEIEKLKLKSQSLAQIKLQSQERVNQAEQAVKITNEQVIVCTNQLEQIINRNKEQEETYLNSKKELLALQKELVVFNQKFNEHSNQEININKKLDQLKQFFSTTINQQDFLLKEEELTRDLNVQKNAFVECQAEYKSLSQKLEELKIPMPEEAICKHCRQLITPEVRQHCQLELNQQIQDIQNKLKSLNSSGQTLNQKEQHTKKILQELQQRKSIFQENQTNFKIEQNKLSNIQTLIKEFLLLKDNKQEEIIKKELIVNQLQQSNTTSARAQQIELLQKDKSSLKEKLHQNEFEFKTCREQLHTILQQETIVLHEIQKKENDSVQLAELKQKLSQLERLYFLHQKVLTAFGSSGIPALITHTILDDYQIEANNILSQLRPGLQLQFQIEKERVDGDLADTLDVVYLLNNAVLEFSQLSGAQKLVVSLALKLGLAAVINKRLGIDLKMLLIDEVDASLDESGLESFEQAIKYLQNDFKILVITHNTALKERFPCVILVEQDQYLNSTINLVK